MDRKLLVVELHCTDRLKFHLYMDKVVAASRTGLHRQSDKRQSVSSKLGCLGCHMSPMLRPPSCVVNFLALKSTVSD